MLGVELQTQARTIRGRTVQPVEHLRRSSWPPGPRGPSQGAVSGTWQMDPNFFFFDQISQIWLLANPKVTLSLPIAVFRPVCGPLWPARREVAVEMFN